jgi:glycosyltransferase involved in cell wall biosynthesis
MSIVIFGDNFSFPEGNAATNRVYSYAKGFIENRVITCVICFRNDYMDDGDGIIEEIQYFHPINRKVRDSSFLKRNWFKFVKYFNTVKIIRRFNKDDKIEAIITYTKISTTHLFSWLLARLTGAKLIIENSEHPLRYYQKGSIKKIVGKLKLWIELKTFDGILLITQHLIDFYKSKLHTDNKLLLVPSTVDPSRFSRTRTNNLPYKYIGYFGSINFERDNVDCLINSFALIHVKFDDLHLVLGGMYSEIEKKLVIDLVNSLKIESYVHLLNYMLRDEIIQYMINAQIIVLVRKNDPNTEASFPSKLIEYIATGNPVISVDVSEISKYLKDGENGFLTKPGDVKELSEKLEYVLRNYQFATEVAQKGKDLTKMIFNYKYQANRILEFIKSV